MGLPVLLEAARETARMERGVRLSKPIIGDRYILESGHARWQGDRESGLVSLSCSLGNLLHEHWGMMHRFPDASMTTKKFPFQKGGQ